MQAQNYGTYSFNITKLVSGNWVLAVGCSFQQFQIEGDAFFNFLQTDVFSCGV